MDSPVFYISGFEVQWIQVVICSLILLGAFLVFIKFYNFSFFEEEHHTLVKISNRGFRFRLGLALVFVSLMLILRILNFDIRMINFGEWSITINHITEILSLFSVAILFDWVVSHVVIRNKYRKREVPVRTSFEHDKNNEVKATRLVRYIVYLYVGQILLKRLGLDLILLQRELKGELFAVHISDIMIAAMILVIAKVLVWFIIQISLYRMYLSKDMDEGVQFAINQLVTYIIYVLAILFALDRLISDMSLVYGGAAALLVGVGLGLQQTFNDFFSGLVLLFERSVMVGDILEFDGQVGRVLKIGLRASRIETRNSVSMLIPNSKLVNQAVSNWTHYDNIVRFQVDVFVAYGSDAQQVKTLLLDALTHVDDVLKTPLPFVRLNEFGDNGLLFSVYFFSTQVMWAEDVRSNIRFEIEKNLRENNITIPYPQRQLWVNDPKSNIL